MAKKSKIKFLFDAPVSTGFVALTAFIFILDNLVLKGKLSQTIFSCPGNMDGPMGKMFSASNPVDYVRIVLYVLGNRSWNVFFLNAIALSLLGPALEERYGSVMVLVMAAAATLVSGVLNVCAVPMPLYGAAPIVFMQIFLLSVLNFTKKSVNVSWLALLIIYIAFTLYTLAGLDGIDASLISGNKFVALLQKNISLLVCLVGGLCGSLFAFLVAPKKTAAKKPSVQMQSEKPETVVSFDDEKE